MEFIKHCIHNCSAFTEEYDPFYLIIEVAYRDILNLKMILIGSARSGRNSFPDFSTSLIPLYPLSDSIWKWYWLTVRNPSILQDVWTLQWGDFGSMGEILPEGIPSTSQGVHRSYW